jgi:CHAT domain-containing protein/Tfp pilus assembly protein PilF
MRQVIFLFFILASLGVRAQDRSYEQMEVDYNRFKSEGMKDSVLLVAREMNEWALKNEGDTSLRYASSFRYIGNGFSDEDSALVYYEKSIDALINQNRYASLDHALVLFNLGGLFARKENDQKAIQFYLRCYDVFVLIKQFDQVYFSICAKRIFAIYLRTEDYESAISLYSNTIEILLKVHKSNNEDIANLSIELAGLYDELGFYSDAEPYYLNACNIFSKTGSFDNVEYPMALASLGIYYTGNGEYNRAKECLVLSLEILYKYHYESDLDLAYVLISMGNLQMKIGDYANARLTYESVCDIYFRIDRTDSYNYLSAKMNLASISLLTGDYVSAQDAFKEVLKVYELHFMDQHQDYATALNNYGLVHFRLGKYVEAERIYLKSIMIREKYLDAKHPDIAMSCMNLGALYLSIRNFSKAFDFSVRARGIMEASIGNNHPDYATNSNNIGLICMRIGDFKKAEKYFLESLHIRENSLNVNHADLAQSQANLASLYIARGDFEKAEKFCKKSIDIQSVSIGAEHPDLAMNLSNLGLIYLSSGRFDEAKHALLSSIELRRSVLGRSHPDYIAGLINLGIAHYFLGEYHESESSLREALQILSDSKFSDSSLLAYCTFNLIRLGFVMGSDKRILEYASVFKRANISDLSNNKNLNSKEKSSLQQQSIFYLQYILGELQKTTYDYIDCNVPFFDLWIYLNGWVGQQDELIQVAVSNSSDTVLVKLYDEYRSLKSQLSREYEFSDKDSISHVIDEQSIVQKLSRLESMLALKLETYNRINCSYGFTELQSKLGIDDAYIDILRLPHIMTNQALFDSSLYMAYIVTRETSSSPLLVSLGHGKQIDEVLYPYLVNQTTNPTSATMDGQVYDLLWKPLEEHLAGKTKIYLSPGGIYHSINPETIYHAETGKYLFEEKEIHMVNSGRSFVDQRIYGNRDYTNRTALIMGAPNFDLSYGADSTLLEDNVSFTYQTMRDLSLDGNRRAAPLPATRSEVEGINKTLTSTAWNTQLLTGNDAMESNLKQMDSPRILHIATHGYFLADIKPENDNGMRMMGMDAQRVAENPMLRSGLLLAGCNKTLADNTQLTGADNGILTAYEAGLLDLSNTELVVLSACETGKGEILNGEGVQGLRKAMTDAGAEHILMSQWKVDDKVTSEYMQTFYGHYALGKSIRESYNLTRNEIKQKYPQPYYWGAFVLVGE